MHSQFITLIAICVVSVVLLPSSVQAMDTVTHGWTVQNLSNPMVDTDRCGRRGLKSNVCDPDGIIDYTEAAELDEQILRLFNDTPCPCAPDICKQRPGGFPINIAIISHMHLDATDSSGQYLSDIDRKLVAAKMFAYQLVKKWNVGRCNEDVIILYSQHDNVLYTVTNEEARKKLTDKNVSNIAMKHRIHFGANKYTNADGLLHIIADYRAVFLGTYEHEKVFAEENVKDHSMDSSSSRTSVAIDSWLTLVLLPVLSTFVQRLRINKNEL